MHALLYRSHARSGLVAADINDIIETAKRRNGQLDVTGLLLYGELEVVAGVAGEFVQWIEGPERAVEDLFSDIEKDPRHAEVEVLGRGSVDAFAGRVEGLQADSQGRLFPIWTMGLVRLSELPATLDGFLRFANSWDGDTLGAAA